MTQEAYWCNDCAEALNKGESLGHTLMGHDVERTDS